MSDKDDIATPDKPRRRASKQSTAAKKAAKKTAKKTAKKAVKKSLKQPAASRQLMDRSQIQDKTRVFALAKTLGMQSKELIIALSDLGLVKVAQSTLTRAEIEQLLDALEQAPATPSAQQDSADTKSAEKEADEKIRHRVRKDVENEINQITEKVEADLEQTMAEDSEDAPIDVEDLVEEISAEEAAEVEAHAAEVEEATEVYAPVFKAPSASRRRVRRSGSGAKESVEKQEAKQEPAEEQIQEPKAIKGSSRLEAQRRRRTERREEERKRSRVVSQAEFLARRESVERTMVVRERARHDGPGKLTQVGVLEDGLLVEHFVDSDESASMIGNIYLGRVQNVLPSMEAAFIDIGQGRNGVLYAGEVDWKSAGLGGRSRRIEQALKSLSLIHI